MGMSLLSQGRAGVLVLVKTSSRILGTFNIFVPFLPIIPSYTQASAEEVSLRACNDLNDILFAAPSLKQPFSWILI
jgi:hypothetical protein